MKAGKIIDRSWEPRPHFVLQTHNGRIVTARIRPEDVHSAAEHYGGSWVSFEYRGGRAYYVPREEEDDE